MSSIILSNFFLCRFLELDILSQGCEDIIAERLSANSLATVLKWSAQPHGSKWVHRYLLQCSNIYNSSK